MSMLPAMIVSGARYCEVSAFSQRDFLSKLEVQTILHCTRTPSYVTNTHVSSSVPFLSCACQPPTTSVGIAFLIQDPQKVGQCRCKVIESYGVTIEYKG